MSLTIYLASVYLTEQVYSLGSGLGFTKSIFKYVRSADESTARDMIEKWAVAFELKVKTIQLTPSTQQELKTYTFPEQILGVSEKEWIAIHRDRDYPEEWIQADIAKFRELQAKLAAVQTEASPA